MTDALREFAAQLAKPKAHKSKVGNRKKPHINRDETYTPHKLESDKWVSEQIVYLVTTTRCKCGATATQTNSIPLVRRFHPLYGIHEEAIGIAHDALDKHLLPIIQEARDVDLDNCHKCINGGTINPYMQKQLFGESQLAMPFSKAFASSRPEKLT